MALLFICFAMDGERIFGCEALASPHQPSGGIRHSNSRATPLRRIGPRLQVGGMMPSFASSSNATDPVSMASFETDVEWQANMGDAYNPYRSKLLADDEDWEAFLESLPFKKNRVQIDPFWEQIRYEAKQAVRSQPEAGPQLYQGVLSQPSLLVAICTVIAHQVETELISAVELKNLFLTLLTSEDEYALRLDLQAAATRSPSVESAMAALLFHNGFHALCTYRVGHCLWLVGRKSLAYYMQSIVSRKYSADIHPACHMGHGIYLRVGAGVVIGETAVVRNDVSILEGVTLGGTGKSGGDRHPKIGNGVILQDGAAVLGNILVNDGAVVTARAIVTKPVPPLAIVSGVPARITAYRSLEAAAFGDDLEAHLWTRYGKQWKRLVEEQAQEKSENHPSN